MTQKLVRGKKCCLGSPWPLHIIDNLGNIRHVLLKPGEMLWYEAARLMHGRPNPFDGEFYENLLLHYQPAHESWYEEKENQVIDFYSDLWFNE